MSIFFIFDNKVRIRNGTLVEIESRSTHLAQIYQLQCDDMCVYAFSWAECVRYRRKSLQAKNEKKFSKCCEIMVSKSTTVTLCAHCQNYGGHFATYIQINVWVVTLEIGY